MEIIARETGITSKERMRQKLAHALDFCLYSEAGLRCFHFIVAGVYAWIVYFNNTVFDDMPVALPKLL